MIGIHELRQFESVYKPSKEVAFCWLRKQYVQLSTEEDHTEIANHANDSLRIWQAAKVESHKQAALYQFEINHLAQANQQLREKAAKAQAVLECTWVKNEDGYFDASCGQSFVFSEPEDKPSSHEFTHCCFCGGKLIEAQEPAND